MSEPLDILRLGDTGDLAYVLMYCNFFLTVLRHQSSSTYISFPLKLCFVSQNGKFEAEF